MGNSRTEMRRDEVMELALAVAEDNLFINSTRNALILLIVALSILIFDDRLARFGPILLFLAALLFIWAFMNYTNLKSRIGLSPYLNIILVVIIIVMIIESLRFLSENTKSTK